MGGFPPKRPIPSLAGGEGATSLQDQPVLVGGFPRKVLILLSRAKKALTTGRTMKKGRASDDGAGRHSPSPNVGDEFDGDIRRPPRRYGETVGVLGQEEEKDDHDRRKCEGRRALGSRRRRQRKGGNGVGEEVGEGGVTPAASGEQTERLEVMDEAEGPPEPPPLPWTDATDTTQEPSHPYATTEAPADPSDFEQGTLPTASASIPATLPGAVWCGGIPMARDGGEEAESSQPTGRSAEEDSSVIPLVLSATLAEDDDLSRQRRRSHPSREAVEESVSRAPVPPAVVVVATAADDFFVKFRDRRVQAGICLVIAVLVGLAAVLAVLLSSDDDGGGREPNDNVGGGGPGGSPSLTSPPGASTSAPSPLPTTVQPSFSPVPTASPTVLSWLQVGDDIFVDGTAGETFGASISASHNGSRVAVGGPQELLTGLVQVFEARGDDIVRWERVGPDIVGIAAGDDAGRSVSISGDGVRLAVGAPHFDAAGLVDRGRVDVYEYAPSSNSWNRLGDALLGGEAEELFGWSVSLSSDGNVVAADGNGGVRVYEYGEAGWSIMGEVVDVTSLFSSSDDPYTRLALSASGTRCVIGQRAYEFVDGSWMRLGGEIAFSGQSVTMSGDGSVIAVARPGSNVNGLWSGQIRAFRYGEEGSWAQMGDRMNGDRIYDRLGSSLSLSFDGNTVLAGGNQVFVYKLAGTSWRKAGGNFGGFNSESVSLSADGRSAFIGGNGRARVFRLT